MPRPFLISKMNYPYVIFENSWGVYVTSNTILPTQKSCTVRVTGLDGSKLNKDRIFMPVALLHPPNNELHAGYTGLTMIATHVFSDGYSSIYYNNFDFPNIQDKMKHGGCGSYYYEEFVYPIGYGRDSKPQDIWCIRFKAMDFPADYPAESYAVKLSMWRQDDPEGVVHNDIWMPNKLDFKYARVVLGNPKGMEDELTGPVNCLEGMKILSCNFSPV